MMYTVGYTYYRPTFVIFYKQVCGMETSHRAFSLTSCCPPTWPSDCADWPGYPLSRAVMCTTSAHGSSCAWTTNGEVHGETITHNNVKRCLHLMNIDFHCYRSGHVGGQHDVTWKCSIPYCSPTPFPCTVSMNADRVVWSTIDGQAHNLKSWTVALVHKLFACPLKLPHSHSAKQHMDRD